jgi:GT2 family glycosyltransferase
VVKHTRNADPREGSIDGDRPLVSVLVVSYNSRLALRDCLAWLAIERTSVPLEVIVVDNRSQDGTVAMVANEFPWVQLFPNSQNRGFAHAINDAITHARGEFLLLVNPDIFASPGTIKTALAALQAHEEVGMVGCKLIRPDGTFDHACKRGFPTVSGALYYFLGLHRLFPGSRRFAQYTLGDRDIDRPSFVDAVNGAFMLVRRSAAEAVGPMDERFWLYAEDLDWCLRFWQADWKILYWPAAVATHIKGASAGTHRSIRLNYAFYRSAWLFYRKHHEATHSRFVTTLVFLGLSLKFATTVIGGVSRSTGRRLALTGAR